MATTRVGIQNVFENYYISFENEPKDPYFSGFLLRSYVPGEPQNGRCIDTIVCDIIGQGATNAAAIGDAMEKMRTLKRTLDSATQPGNYTPLNYVTHKPVGALYAVHSLLLGGGVSAPSADYLSTKAIISDVVVTVVREGFWRYNVPDTLNTTSMSWAYSSKFWNKSSITVRGDLPSLVSLVMPYQASLLYRYLFISYRSQRLHPRDWNASIIDEAESGTMGTDTASQASAGASNGNVAKCTFATTSSNALRLTKITARRGTYRIFARMWCDSGTSVECYLQLTRHTGAAKGIVVQPYTTSQTLFDMGAFQLSRDAIVSDINYTITPQQYLELYARRVSGAGGLYVDCLFMMPCDEGYLRFSNPSPYSIASDFCYVYDNTRGKEIIGTVDYWAGSSAYIDPAGTINGVGRMAFQPGAGQIQVLWAHDNMKQDFDPSGLGIPAPAVRFVECYNSPYGTP